MPVYPEIWAGPARSYRRDSSGNPVLSRKKYVTIHNTSNDATAEGEAAYAKTRTDGTSSHYYCDHDSLLQSLNTDWCAGHVGSYEGNTYGISYEITGFNGWTRAAWLGSVAWELLARQMAVDCREFGIPVRLLTIDEMRAKTYKGFITHDMARIAWGATTHTDPGPGFPMDHLLARVTAHLNGDDMSWLEPLAGTADNPTRTAGDAVTDIWHATHGVTQKIAAELDTIRADVAELKGRPPVQPAPVDLDALAANLGPVIEAAAERAVRRVLGAVDGATPA